MKPSKGVPSIMHILMHTLQLLARVLMLGSMIILAVWLVWLGTQKYTDDKPWRVFPPDYGCDDRLLLDSCIVKELLYMWLVPAVLAFASLALLALRARLNSHEDARKGLLGRLGSRLLPPKRFWLWWCGGMSVSDALMVAFWITFNVTWAVACLTRFWTLIPFFSKVSENPGGLEFQLVAVAFGVLLMPNFVLLFYPVTRGSVVLQAAGVSYPDAIRYHRWLGHAVMVLVTAHSLGFWVIWLIQGKFVQEAFDQGRTFNNLAGGVSFLGGLALWLSSLEVARRASYEVFYKLHHIGFWIFTFAGCCHYSEMIYFFLPGLVLYGVDGVYRIHQGLGWWGSTGSGSSGGVQVLEAVASEGKTMCSLLIAAPRFGIAASGFVWLNVPELSWHSWHPFEYFAVPAGNATSQPGSNGLAAMQPPKQQQQQTAMLLHIKGYDRWTNELVDLVAAKGVNITVKIEGPYAELPGAVLGHPEVGGGCCKHTAAAAGGFGGKAAAGKDAATSGDGHEGGGLDGIVIAAGGVGATAAMSVFQELATSGEAAAARGLPTLLIWCCRKADELEFLAPRLFAMAHALGLNLTVKLFCTGDPGATSGAALAATNKSTHAPAATAATAATSAAGSSSSSGSGALTTSSMCPVVGLRSFWCQVGHKTLLHVIAFAGTFLAILAVRYMAVVRPALAGNESWTTGQKGAALVPLISAAILLPGLLALWAALGMQAWQQRSHQAGKNGVNQPSAAGSSGIAAAAAAVLPAAAPSAAKKELSRHLLSEDDSTPHGTPTAAAAAAAAAANPLAATAAAAEDVAAVAAAAAGSCAAVRAAAGGWELVLPGVEAGALGDTASSTAATTAAGGCFGIQQGRPPLQPLLASWLGALQQLPQQQQLRQVAVYGMGPSRLVEDVKLLCDVVNGHKGSKLFLGFVQKTHEL